MYQKMSLILSVVLVFLKLFPYEAICETTQSSSTITNLDNSTASVEDYSFTAYKESLQGLRYAANMEDRLHHSDECDPEQKDRIFHRLMNTPYAEISPTLSARLANDILATCDWKRYMNCDPVRKRCVCGPNSIWFPREHNSSNSKFRRNGECLLQLDSPCYESAEAHAKDKANNVLGIHPPYTQCAYDGTVAKCINGSCTCLDPSSPNCTKAKSISTARLTDLLTDLTALTWARLGEPCDFDSPDIVNTRIHSPRSITVILKQWKARGFMPTRICDMFKDLECMHNHTLHGQATCQCQPRTTWYNGTCYGEQGSFCEQKFWIESHFIGYRTPCMPELTCTHVAHPGGFTGLYACCYIGAYSYRSLEYKKSERLFCPLGTSITTPPLVLLAFTIYFASMQTDFIHTKFI